jgi:hypothetical protein
VIEHTSESAPLVVFSMKIPYIGDDGSAGAAMKNLWRVCAFLVFAVFSTPALPWGAEGHQLVGAIADLFQFWLTNQNTDQISGHAFEEKTVKRT